VIPKNAASYGGQRIVGFSVNYDRMPPRCEPLAWGCIDEQRQRHDVFRAIRGNRAIWAFRGI